MKKLIIVLAVLFSFCSCKKDLPSTQHQCNCNPVKVKLVAIECVTAPCPAFMLQLENGATFIPDNLSEFDYTPKNGDSLMVCLRIDSLTTPPENYVSISCIEGITHFYTASCNDTPPVGELCLAYFERWFYNKATQKCTKIGYSGCSQRGFATQVECESCKQ
jgi:hypothetical protein